MRWIAILLIGLWSTLSQAEVEELSFDEFVSRYGDNQVRYKPKKSDPFDNIFIHAGVGYISSLVSVEVPIQYSEKAYIKEGDESKTPVSPEEALKDGELVDGYEEILVPVAINDKFQSFQNGIQISLGIDLFSQYWSAEGTIRNYTESRSNGRRIDLQEFDLKLVYQSLMANRLGYKTGMGLGARYLTVEDASKSFRKEFSSPASVIFFGLESHLSNSVSLGAELASRNSLISDAPDKSSFDLTLRLDTHF